LFAALKEPGMRYAENVGSNIAKTGKWNVFDENRPLCREIKAKKSGTTLITVPQ
jgi:hypothetical protein